ncbi:hypothetical protein CBS101457_004536 [Exobasidium rhododendri]|nr:hypothetical protein CBS101457_004536 [Exobasidium rhododendri]
MGEGHRGKGKEGMPTPTATPIGGRSFASPAMIRILLTPAHSKVTPDEFELMAGAIRRVESMRLSDLPESHSRGESVASTSALGKMGEVHLSFITSYDASHSFLAPFNHHRQVLGVLGLSCINSNISLEEVEQSPAALRQLHPGAVIHRVFAFDTGAARPQTVDLSSLQNPAEAIQAVGLGRSSTANTGFSGRGTSGLVVFPAVRKDLKDVKFYLKTLLPEFVNSILDGLDLIVKGLQGKPLETPRETLEGNLNNPPASSPTSNKMIGAAGSAVGTAASRASALFSSFSAEEKKSMKGSKSSQSLNTSGPLGAGRYAKVKADYYLLVGDLWNALHTYDSCLTLLGKERALAGGQDAVWYASGLEGWAVSRYLVKRMGGTVEEKAPCLAFPLGGSKEKEKSESQLQSKAWSDIAEAYSQALTIYTKCLAPTSYLLESWKSINPDTPRDYTHPLIHTSACLAFSRLLLAIWASGGWNGETFDQLLYGGVPPALAETTRPTLAVYSQHSTASGVQRHDISGPASLAMTNSSTNGLKLLDQINLFSSLAAIFGAIGFTRKEAYAIRRLQALVVSLIAKGILLQKREVAMTSQVIRRTSEEAQTMGSMLTMTSFVGAGENSDSILVLALQICQTYGVDVQKMPVIGLDEQHILSRAAVDVKNGKRLSSPLLNRGRGSWAHAMSPVQPSDWQKYADEEQIRSGVIRAAPSFGWIQQQILILKDTLGVCEMLQDDASLLFFASILLKDFWSYLSAADQTKLKTGIEKVQSNLHSKGHETLLEYWGPLNILDDIQYLNRPQEEMQEIDSRDVAAAEKKHGPIPWDSTTNKKRSCDPNDASILVDGEMASFEVTLYNPLSIPLELEKLQLDISRSGSVGPQFEAVEDMAVVLPPISYRRITLTGTPQGEGRLYLRGIILKLSSCVERKFAFERTDGENKLHLVKLQSDWDDRWTRTKQFGIDARNSSSVDVVATSKGTVRPENRFVMMQVIPKVPRLVLQGISSLRNGNLVLLDGEERTIHLTLLNRSDLDIDHIQFRFEDDLSSEILSLLSEGHLNPVDVYDLEDDLLNRPFLSMDAPQEDRVISARQKKTFSFRLRGKLDVRSARISAQYGHIKTGKELGRDRFWSRNLLCEFQVRVVSVVAIDALEIKQVAEGDEDEEEKGDDDGTRSTTEKDQTIMVGMRVHNLYSSNVTVDWKLSNARSPLQCQIPANTTTHVYFTMPKLALSDHYLSQPIPHLIERQFILSKIQQTAEESRLIKSRFWTRFALLQLMEEHAWTIEKTGQRGEIGLGGVYVEDEQMASMLVRDDLFIRVQFDPVKVHKCQFVNLTVKIRNNTADKSIHGIFKLVPAVQERLLNLIQCTGGHLQGQLKQYPLSPGQSTELQVGLCFLSSGKFPFTLLIQGEGDHHTLKMEKRIEVVVWE